MCLEEVVLEKKSGEHIKSLCLGGLVVVLNSGFILESPFCFYKSEFMASPQIN